MTSQMYVKRQKTGGRASSGLFVKNSKGDFAEVAANVSSAATLRTELAVRNHGVGQLSSSLSHTVTNAISVFLNPGASEAMIDASIKDVIAKLPRARKLLRSNSICVDVVFDKEQEAVVIQKYARRCLARRELQRRRQVREEEAQRKQEERATLVTKAGGEQVTNSNGKARAAESSSMASARAEVELVVAKPKAEQLTSSTSNSGAAGSSSMHAGASAEAESRI